MPKTHARFLWLRLLCFLWLLILLLLIALELFLAYAFTSTGADSLTWEIYVLNVVILGGYTLFRLLRAFFRFRAWKRFERRRQDAVQGQQSLLAVEQPVRNPSALTLPSTIIHRPSWLPFVKRVGILLVAFVAVVILSFSVSFTSTAGASSDVVAVAYLYAYVLMLAIILIGYCIYLFWALYAREYRRIVLTKDGLHVSGLFTRPRFIAWKDVKLVALVSLYRIRFSQPRYQVEVSSVDEVVYWPWPRQTISTIPYFNDPSGASREYEQQVYNVLSVITARTGLPLYDLRQR